jgi:hypothetical protein
MSGIEIALMAASTAIAAGSAVMQGQQASSAAKYNAQVASVQAQQARDAAAYEEARHRERLARALGAQRAGYAHAGVAAEGTPLLAAADSAAQGELDALAIRYSGDAAAARANSEAALQRLYARNYATSGYMNAGGSLLTGATGIARELNKKPGAT